VGLFLRTFVSAIRASGRSGIHSLSRAARGEPGAAPPDAHLGHPWPRFALTSLRSRPPGFACSLRRRISPGLTPCSVVEGRPVRRCRGGLVRLRVCRISRVEVPVRAGLGPCNCTKLRSREGRWRASESEMRCKRDGERLRSVGRPFPGNETFAACRAGPPARGTKHLCCTLESASGSVIGLSEGRDGLCR
jgi:hypothetical protein